ncbi:MAG: hybrid sensor histidine kinase/response regulator [Rubrivivax sp.]
MPLPEDTSAWEQLALRHAQCALFSFSDDGRLRYANAQLHRWLGREPGTLVGEHIDKLLAPASRVFHSTHFFPLLKLHGHADEIHLLLRDTAGHDVPAMVSAVRITEGDQPLNHCSLMTLWRRKELEVALIEARNAAEAATAAKDEFLAVVSHELRSPLSAITGWVRVARVGKLEPAALERALETIERNALLQVTLIEDLIDVSRIVSGKMRIRPRPIQLAPLVQAAMDSALPAAQAKHVALVLALDSDAGVVNADATRVQQIVWNLVSNALKFTPRGGQVQATVTRAESRVRIEVADTGAGIAATQLPFVFDHFWQADSAAHRGHSGLGLGLAICKNLVELHGGSIQVRSSGLGEGAVFTVEFPLVVAAAREQASNSAVVETAVVYDGGALQGVRVLVLDDDGDACKLLTMLLEGEGATVVCAQTVDEAMQRVREVAPQVVLSDIGLQDKTGYDFIRSLRAEPLIGPGIAAIAVTGLDRPRERVKLLRAGFQAQLVKPVDPAEVVALIGALLPRG